MDRQLVKEAVTAIHDKARDNAPVILGLDDDDVGRIIRRVTLQDPWWASKRIHASAAALLALVLGAAGVDWEEAQLLEIFGAAATLVAAVLPLLSKVSDLRATRS